MTRFVERFSSVYAQITCENLSKKKVKTHNTRNKCNTCNTRNFTRRKITSHKPFGLIATQEKKRGEKKKIPIPYKHDDNKNEEYKNKDTKMSTCKNINIQNCGMQK